MCQMFRETCKAQSARTIIGVPCKTPHACDSAHSCASQALRTVYAAIQQGVHKGYSAVVSYNITSKYLPEYPKKRRACLCMLQMWPLVAAH